MTNLAELIERLEKASGPNRDLDQEIAILHHSEKTGKRLVGVANCAAYTRSLDAALTLVPEGFGWGVNFDRGIARANWRNQVTGESMPFPAGAATPALALCIAALRARA